MAETNPPVEPEALVELIRGNRLALQAHFDSIGKLELAVRLKGRNSKNESRDEEVTGTLCLKSKQLDVRKDFPSGRSLIPIPGKKMSRFVPL